MQVSLFYKKQDTQPWQQISDSFSKPPHKALLISPAVKKQQVATASSPGTKFGRN